MVVDSLACKLSSRGLLTARFTIYFPDSPVVAQQVGLQGRGRGGGRMLGLASVGTGLTSVNVINIPDLTT